MPFVRNRYLLILFVFIGLVACTSDEDNDAFTSRIYGKWYIDKKCKLENYIYFNEDNSFLTRYSLNETCNLDGTPALDYYDVFESSGTYEIDKDNISFNYLTNAVKVVENPAESLTVTNLNILISKKIITLNDSILRIETKTTYGPTFGVTTHIANYSRASE